MRITTMCPKCGSIQCYDESETSICHYCNTKRIQVDFSGDEVYNTPTTEFYTLVDKINRKFLYQLPTFDEEAYEARIKKITQANANIKKMFKELDNLPRCPYCKSVNLSKISSVSKVGKIAMFGIFGMGDNGKTWKCNNCGSKF